MEQLQLYCPPDSDSLMKRVSQKIWQTNEFRAISLTVISVTETLCCVNPDTVRWREIKSADFSCGTTTPNVETFAIAARRLNPELLNVRLEQAQEFQACEVDEDTNSSIVFQLFQL